MYKGISNPPVFCFEILCSIASYCLSSTFRVSFLHLLSETLMSCSSSYCSHSTPSYIAVFCCMLHHMPFPVSIHKAFMSWIFRLILSKPAPADHQVHPDLLTGKPIKSVITLLWTVIGCERFGLNPLNLVCRRWIYHCGRAQTL